MHRNTVLRGLLASPEDCEEVERPYAYREAGKPNSAHPVSIRYA